MTSSSQARGKACPGRHSPRLAGAGVRALPIRNKEDGFGIGLVYV
jgi:hypothetical protein